MVNKLGTIVSGPITGAGYTWWIVNFDTGCDGYVVQNYLSLVTVAAESFTSTLTVGSTGPEVLTLQAYLTSIGLFSSDITGYFGNITKAAVAQFQAQNNLAAVGMVGPQTRELLRQSMSKVEY